MKKDENALRKQINEYERKMVRRYSGDVSKTKLSQRLLIAKQELKQKEQRRKSMAFDICSQIIEVISNSAKSNQKCSL